MIGASTLRTAWGLPLAGLYLLLALACLPAAPSSTVTHGVAASAGVIPATPALPDKPALRAAETGDAPHRRALGRQAADQGSGVQPDVDGPHALAAIGPAEPGANRSPATGPGHRGDTAKPLASIAFRTRAPPVAA